MFLEKLEGWSNTGPVFVNCILYMEHDLFYFGINYCLAFVGI